MVLLPLPVCKSGQETQKSESKAKRVAQIPVGFLRKLVSPVPQSRHIRDFQV